MRKRKLRFGLGLVLIVLGPLVQPASVTSQCSVTNTVKVPAPSPTSPYSRVYKYLNGPYQCNRVAINNASLCAPGPAGTVRTRLTASASTAASNPSCQFYCTGGCGTIVIDGDNGGLPVELMSFSVD